MKRAIVREATVGHEEVSVRMPSDVLDNGLGGTLGEVEEKLSTLAEDPAQEAGHGEDDMTMGNGREHLFM